jgi:hypothetical protein
MFARGVVIVTGVGLTLTIPRRRFVHCQVRRTLKHFAV